jgi:hypothetical protein
VTKPELERFDRQGHTRQNRHLAGIVAVLTINTLFRGALMGDALLEAGGKANLPRPPIKGE